MLWSYKAPLNLHQLGGSLLGKAKSPVQLCLVQHPITLMLFNIPDTISVFMLYLCTTSRIQGIENLKVTFYSSFLRQREKLNSTADLASINEYIQSCFNLTGLIYYNRNTSSLWKRPNSLVVSYMLTPRVHEISGTRGQLISFSKEASDQLWSLVLCLSADSNLQAQVRTHLKKIQNLFLPTLSNKHFFAFQHLY